MKEIICILIFCLLPFLSFGQNEKLDFDKTLYDRGKTLQELLYYTNLFELSSLKNKMVSENANKTINQILEKALENYTELVRNYPKSELL